MSKKSTGKLISEPTKAELEILQVIWAHGPSTVRFVYEELNKEKEVIYTSTLKQMQVMTEKGLLKRDESAMKHIYRPAESEEKVRTHYLHKFIESFYNGSPVQLMMQLLGDSKTSKKDLQNVKEILKKLDKKS